MQEFSDNCPSAVLWLGLVAAEPPAVLTGAVPWAAATRALHIWCVVLHICVSGISPPAWRMRCLACPLQPYWLSFRLGYQRLIMVCTDHLRVSGSCKKELHGNGKIEMLSLIRGALWSQKDSTCEITLGKHTGIDDDILLSLMKGFSPYSKNPSVMKKNQSDNIGRIY